MDNTGLRKFGPVLRAPMGTLDRHDIKWAKSGKLGTTNQRILERLEGSKSDRHVRGLSPMFDLLRSIHYSDNTKFYLGCQY